MNETLEAVKREGFILSNAALVTETPRDLKLLLSIISVAQNRHCERNVISTFVPLIHDVHYACCYDANCSSLYLNELVCSCSSIRNDAISAVGCCSS